MPDDTVTCNCHDRTHLGDFPLLLMHMQDCRHLYPELKALVVGLVRGIEEWSSDEDGVHPLAWEAYSKAKLAIGEPIDGRHVSN